MLGGCSRRLGRRNRSYAEQVRRLRFVVQPNWLALHVLTVALVVTMVLLGRWQLTVSEDKGFSLQNFGYALQWWAFSAFVLGMWGRALRDAYRKTRPGAGSPSEAAPEPRTIGTAPAAYRRYVMPTMTTRADDPVHNAYNDFLARLAADDLSTEDLTVEELNTDELR